MLLFTQLSCNIRGEVVDEIEKLMGHRIRAFDTHCFIDGQRFYDAREALRYAQEKFEQNRVNHLYP